MRAGSTAPIERFVAARDRLLAAAESDVTVDDVLAAVMAALHEGVGFEAGGVVLTDPDTLLPFGGVVEGLSADNCIPFWDNELRDPDFVKFAALARSADPVASLHEATDGELERSPRYQKLYRPMQAVDELRIAFTSGRSCWAVAWLMRPESMGPFTAREIDQARRLAPLGARAISGALTRRDARSGDTAPAMLVVGPSGVIESMTQEAESVIDDLSIRGIDSATVPTAVLVAARRAANNKSSTRIALRARSSSGRWLKLHASPLGDDGRVAVMIQPAAATDLVPILLESYGLTERESDVVLLVARGFSTKEMASELNLSPHTVQDHVKAIFGKCGVSSRGELVASLFAHHIHEHHHAAVAHL